MKAKDTRRLVIDADVARSAGNVQAIARESTCCRDFLMAMQKIGHFIVMTPALTEEWMKHRSRVSSTWLTRMQQSGKVKTAKGDAYSGLEHQIKSLRIGVNQKAAMLKDKHLIGSCPCHS